MTLPVVRNVQTQVETFASGSGFTLSSYAVGAESDRVLIVFVHGEFVPSSARPISGITFGGVALTEAEASQNSFNGTDIWYLINPSNATSDIVVTLGDTLTGNGLVIGACYLSGADQTAPIGATNVNNNGSSVAVTTTAADSIVIGGCDGGSGSSLAGDAGQTELYTINNTGTSGVQGGAYEEAASTASYTLEWTDVGQRANCAAVEILAATGGGGSTTNQSLTGTLTRSAALATQATFGRAVTGAMSRSATMAEAFTVNQSLTGSMSRTASIVKLVKKGLSAAVIRTAAFTKRVSKGLTASMARTASVDPTTTFQQALAGAMSRTASIAAGSRFTQSLTASMSRGASLATSFIKASGAILTKILWPIMRAILRAPTSRD